MTNANVCPQCGSPLADATAAGLCPVCLLKRGMENNTAGASSAWQPPALGELAGQFPNLEILELLGRGGMGAVYKVRQKELNRVAALKILPPDIAAEAGFAERFTREARALAKLNHPGIVTLYEFGRAPSGLFFFLMEFVDGANLRQLMESGRIAPREALAIVPQVCDALQYAHDNGIVHRDIKPENILLDRKGRVKVADFGLAKLTQEDSAVPPQIVMAGDLTQAGHVFGTPQYMAPEQLAEPHQVDHRVDIYALGVVFYQMLTGELPASPLSPPSQKVRIDVRLDQVVLRALEQTPQRRYAQASEFKTDVQTIAGGSAPAASGEARMSRAAVAGACLAPLILGLIPMFWVHAVPAGEYTPPPLWVNLMAFLITTVAAGSPFATTILGWIAVAQIRHSAGRVYGLGLALFDGLFYPLLALDGLIGWLISQALDLYLGFDATGDLRSRPLAHFISVERVPLFWFSTVFICVLMDRLLISLVWRSFRPSAQSVSRRSLFAAAAIVLAALALPAIPLACDVWSLSEAAPAVPVEFHYRVFEVSDAELVDRLIPAEARKSAVTPGMPPAPFNTMPGEDREALAADVDQATLDKLVAGAAHFGILTENRRAFSFWPRVAESWSYARMEGNITANGGGVSYLGARRVNGRLQVNIECAVNHLMEQDIANRRVDTVSEIRYQDFAPEGNRALVFLVPVTHGLPLTRDGSRSAYLIIAFEITPQ